MKVVDTSAWIEFLIGSPIGNSVAPMLPTRSEWIVPTIVQFELHKWLCREKGEDTADAVIAYSMTCRTVALDTEIALAAADLARSHQLASADAIIYATARGYDAELLTCDRHFVGLDGVTLFEKPR